MTAMGDAYLKIFSGIYVLLAILCVVIFIAFRKKATKKAPTWIILVLLVFYLLIAFLALYTGDSYYFSLGGLSGVFGVINVCISRKKGDEENKQ
jgi:uncharacterized membrane protein